MSAVIFVGRPTQPHIVNAKYGSDRCDCEAIKSRNICPHVIAVAHSNGELQELTVKWEPNLSNLVQSSIAKAAGRKSGPKRNRFSRASEQRDVSRLQDPLRILMLLQKRNRLISMASRFKSDHLLWPRKQFSPFHEWPLPSEPYDMIFCGKQVRAYPLKGSVGLRFTLKPENVFFHLKRSHVEMKNSDGVSADSLLLSDVDKVNLKTSHKMMLRK